MSAPAPQCIALRLMDGHRLTVRDLRSEYGLGQFRAAELLERAEEIRTGWMLMRFPRPELRS
jgi:hypothetical protein